MDPAPLAWGGLEALAKSLKEELLRACALQLHQRANQSWKAARGKPLLSHGWGLPLLPHPFSKRRPQGPHKPDSALAGGHGVSNFERGLLQNVRFRARARLPTSCPDPREWDLLQEEQNPMFMPLSENTLHPRRAQGLRLHGS